jgi:hypothetical protein
MPCFKPLRAWQAKAGGPVKFVGATYTDARLSLPCGQCIGCKIERTRSWALRMMHEAHQHERNSFITLTYNKESLPKNESLDVKHWKLFAKKLRHRCGPFRYFHCGEYGDENMRPHLHACIFGLNFEEDRSYYKTVRENDYYVSSLLEDSWGRGFCTLGELTFQSAAYVARYVMKKITGEQAEYAYEGIDPETGEMVSVAPEYATMSRRPGLGAGWFEKFSSDVYPSDEVILAGERYRPPRFYDDKVGEDELKGYKEKRREKVKERLEDLTPQRLKEREEVLRRKVRLLKREV